MIDDSVMINTYEVFIWLHCGKNLAAYKKYRADHELSAAAVAFQCRKLGDIIREFYASKRSFAYDPADDDLFEEIFNRSTGFCKTNEVFTNFARLFVRECKTAKIETITKEHGINGHFQGSIYRINGLA